MWRGEEGGEERERRKKRVGGGISQVFAVVSAVALFLTSFSVARAHLFETARIVKP